MNFLARLPFILLLVGYYCQADERKNDRYLEKFGESELIKRSE